MYPSYNYSKRALNADDVAGIQAIYGTRQADVYGGANNSFQTAADLSSALDPVNLSTVVNNLDLTSTSSAEYFTVTAPDATDGTLTVNVQSAGLSLLRPAVTVFAADRATVLASATGCGYKGSTLSLTVSGVNPGDQFYIEVTGADSTAFGTGDFALAVNFGSGPMPAVSFPNTQVLNGTPLTGGGIIGMAAQDMMEVGTLHGKHQGQAPAFHQPEEPKSAGNDQPAGQAHRSLPAHATDAFFVDLGQLPGDLWTML